MGGARGSFPGTPPSRTSDLEEGWRLFRDGMSAHAICAQGRFQEALRLARAVEEAESDWKVSQVVWRSAAGKALAGLGDRAESSRLAHEAVVIAEGTDAIDLHGDALMDLAEVLRRTGEPEGGAAAVSQALGLYERKGNLVSAARARAAIEDH
jgi:ATP/maltotriose-dependent transcriptional regulator MalT